MIITLIHIFALVFFSLVILLYAFWDFIGFVYERENLKSWKVVNFLVKSLLLVLYCLYFAGTISITPYPHLLSSMSMSVGLIMSAIILFDLSSLLDG